MNELLAELEQDLRNERLQKLWHSFGKVMVALSVAVILVTVAVVLVHEHRQSRAMQQTAQFMAGLDRMGVEDYAGAAAIFDAMAQDLKSPYYGMAMMQKARAEGAGGDREAAEKAYAALAEHDRLFGELAQMMVPEHAVDPDRASPFYHTLAEWRAWQIVEGGKKEEALKLFIKLRDDSDAPPTLRERSAEAAQYLSGGSGE